MARRKKEEIVEEIDEQTALMELGKGFSEAEEIIKDQEKTEDFLEQLEAKMKIIPRVGNTLAMLPTLISLVRDYVQKKYRKVPLGTIIAVVSALLYFLTPVDMIPDAILGVGYIDDALVVAACLKLVRSDVDEYENWKKTDKKSQIN